MQRLRNNIPPGVRRTALLALSTALLAVFAFSGSVLAKSGNGEGDRGRGNDNPGGHGQQQGNGQAGAGNPGNGGKSGGSKGNPSPATGAPKGGRGNSKNGGGKGHGKGRGEGRSKGGDQGGNGKAGGGRKAPGAAKSPSANNPAAPTNRHGSQTVRRGTAFARKLKAPGVSPRPSTTSSGARKTSADIGWARRLASNCVLLEGDRHGPRHGDKPGHSIGLGHRKVECSAPAPTCEAVVRVERHKAPHGDKPGHQRGRGHFKTVKVECPPPSQIAGPPAPLPLPVVAPIASTGAPVAVPADTTAPRARIAGRFSRCVKRRIRVSTFSFDLSGVAKIEFYLGTRLIRRIAQPRDSHRITLRTGRRSGTLRMVVTDAAGQSTTVKRFIRACPAKVTRRIQPRLAG